MIQAKEIKPGEYMVTLDKPETHILRAIAGAYSFTDVTALKAVINRGMDSIGKQVQQVDGHDKDRCEGG